MTNTRDFHAELSRFIESYPALVFNNDGYEQLPAAVTDTHKDAIAKIEAILKDSVQDFIRFQNFKPRKDGSVAVRCQTAWSPYFVGVSYIPLEDFKLKENPLLPLSQTLKD